MTLEELRQKHTSLIYRSFWHEIAENDVLVSFELMLSGNQPEHLESEDESVTKNSASITFYPKISLKNVAEDFLNLPNSEQNTLLFHLGMAELLSYWKSACPATIRIDAAIQLDTALTISQLRWWHHLLVFGMSEFYFVNDIPTFGDAGFVRWQAPGPEDTTIEYVSENLSTLKKQQENWRNTVQMPEKNHNKSAQKVLIPVGGGKDSVVTLDFFKTLPSKSSILILNPIPASLAIANEYQKEQKSADFGASDILTVQRTIDPKLFQLNLQGYLNGHTPFSSYLAFLSYTVAHITGHTSIALSNEQSANEGNAFFHGVDINHQYSKSSTFEFDFQKYALEYLPGTTDYFSLLRPLHELAIARLFAKIMEKKPSIGTHFLSCNVGGRENHWCKKCPKCLFSFTLLFPFLGEMTHIDSSEVNSRLGFEVNPEKFEVNPKKTAGSQSNTAPISRLFETNLFEDVSLIDLMRDLLGEGTHKPLECVGLYEETLVSAWKSIEYYENLGKTTLPPVLEWVKREVLDSMNPQDLKNKWNSLANTWNEPHGIPAQIELPFKEWISKMTKENVLLLGLGREARSTWDFLQANSGSGNEFFAVNEILQADEIWLADEKPLNQLDTFWQGLLETKKVAGYIQVGGGKTEHTNQNLLEDKTVQKSKNPQNYFDTIIRTPGISRKKITNEYGLRAKQISSNTQLAFDWIAQQQNNPTIHQKITTIGITGTKGKSTTTALIDAVLRDAFGDDQVILAGNIGIPPLDVLKKSALVGLQKSPGKNTPLYLVFELSCHQLSDLHTSPNIAVIQAITPEHLDYYDSMEEYAQAKSSIARYQNKTDIMVYFDPSSNGDLVGTRGLSGSGYAAKIAQLSPGKKIVFGPNNPDNSSLFPENFKMKIVGEHNTINAVPALIIARELGASVGRGAHPAPPPRHFPGLPHRLQHVITQNEISYYNDSLATTPEAAAVAISSFPHGSVILLAGGHERNLDFAPLAQVILTHQVQTLILFPTTGKRILESVIESVIGEHANSDTKTRILPEHFFVQSMEEAISIAKKVAKPGQVVLLSPAAPSFGIFKDYADRGEQFSTLAQQA